MWLILVFSLIFFYTSSGNPVDVTFKNVTFRGYQMFTPKFKPTILLGNNLKDFLPKLPFDNIEFLDQKIPIIYKEAITDISQLYELDMDFCEIKEIRPGAFRNLTNLNRMSFKMNQLRRIENGVFNKLPVETIDLSFNQISYIHTKAFDDMPELFQINLGTNWLSKWNPDWFTNTPKLSVLYFRNNFIEELPAESFKNLKKERYVTIDLIFNGNRISSIHRDAFEGLKQIHILSLSNNLLQNFDKNLLKNVVVKYLKLNNNSIACFDDLDEVFKATYAYIDNNPIKCDCLKKIQTWSEKNHKDVGVADMNCPEDHHNIIEIEDVQELAKDIYAIQKITLILPDNEIS
ncbi:leucine-rich repeat-containing protein 70-like [Diorhabda carinulata]|uniref:leucine-rich repeat-containing protein 70-like n=1 Tax=Diorhabda carinulata TaxID=1163345 RepID=UPI0025A17319|nr:leucine-rich repeat-containing protein 70-like [Diorhabda carinulata]